MRTRHLCDIRVGWRSQFVGDWLVLVHKNYSAYYIKICDIVRGAVFPPESYCKT